MKVSRSLFAPLACFAVASLGCAAEVADPAEVVEYEEPFTSDVATLLDFEFDAEVIGPSKTNARGSIKAQLMYLVGQLNAHDGVARLERTVLSNVVTTYYGSGLYRTRYHAKVPVAWGSKTNLPSSFALNLPIWMNDSGQRAFIAKYGPTCNDGDAHDVTNGNYWYHFRPAASGCAIDPVDVSRSTASARLSDQNSVAKYPEYDKIWEDGALNIVALFGKYDDGATSNDDAGIWAYNQFLGRIRGSFAGGTVTPSTLGDSPGVSAPEVTFQLPLSGGRQVTLTVMLIDSPKVMTATQQKRYAELTPWADMIMYNGHAGLGANVRALSGMGTFVPGKYQMFFFDNCDTFAYIDESLFTTRKTVNPDDAAGTKYMDIVSTAMPAYFNSMPTSVAAFVSALMNPELRQSYQKIFKSIDPQQVTVVTGEEDNQFNSTTPIAPTFNKSFSGSVGYKAVATHDFGTLTAGTYRFSLTPDWAVTGGDADLRVQVGSNAAIRCGSYKANSNELCSVTVTGSQPVSVTVTGDKRDVQSRYTVRAWSTR